MNKGDCVAPLLATKSVQEMVCSLRTDQHTNFERILRCTAHAVKTVDACFVIEMRDRSDGTSCSSSMESTANHWRKSIRFDLHVENKLKG